jgi:hypothetical protein
MNDSKLHVIIPYFNHTNAGVNRRNLELCLRNLSITPDCLVVLVEGIWNRNAELPDFSGSLFRHLKFDLGCPIWVKENLINLGIASLGDNWECAAWIDKDILFLNPGWAKETILKLGRCDIIQPWSRCLSLNEVHEVDDGVEARHFMTDGDLKGSRSFCYAKDHPPLVPCRTGNAWAIRKSFYQKIGKLFDHCIIGGGDTAITVSINQRSDAPHMKLYGRHFQDYLKQFRGARIGYVEGSIIHYHHGDFGNRQYNDRLKKLDASACGGFNPATDLDYAENGTLRLHNPALEASILEYFISREEHLV